MSLGFNHNRKHRSSTLPGTVNPQLIRERRPPATTAAAVVRRKSPPTPPTPVPTKTSQPPPPPPPAPVSSRDDEIHTVYATVAVALLSESDGSVVASVGDRVVLVYPMASDAEDGRITMKLKSVHPNTGQLSYNTVTVYDPNTETRYATKFSLIP